MTEGVTAEAKVWSSSAAATLAVLWLTLSIFLTESTGNSSVRLLIYGLPPALLFLALVPAAGAVFSREATYPVLAALFAVFASTIVNVQADEFVLRNITFISLCFAVLAIRVSPREGHLKVALFTMLGGTLLLYGVRASPVPTLDPTLLSSGFLESSYGFSAGAIAIYFLHRRKMLWGFLGICVTVLLFKRTAILAVFVLGVLPLIFPVSRGERRLPFAALVGICAAIAIAGLEANRIFEFLYSSLGLTQSLNAYTLGRYGYNALLESALRDASLTQQILGSGPGAAERALTIAFGGTASSNIQPHNDFLRILFEYGWVGLGVFLFSLCRIFASSTLLQKLLIYQMILFVTDNTLIYLFHFVVLSLLLGADNKEPVRERLAT